MFLAKEQASLGRYSDSEVSTWCLGRQGTARCRPRSRFWRRAGQRQVTDLLVERLEGGREAQRVGLVAVGPAARVLDTVRLDLGAINSSV
jgi:hypothetical protein